MPGSARGDFYRAEANRVRELARRIAAPDLREQMERLASDYEALAEVADRLWTGGLPPS